MAVVSETMIGNLALSHIGAKAHIQSLDEDSAEAEAVKLWFDTSRQMMLEGYDWKFARKRVTLAQDTEDPPENIWSYRYVYPSDALTIRKLQQPTYTLNPLFTSASNTLAEPDAIPFEIEMDSTGERRTILTDLEDAIAVYTFDQENVGLFSTFSVYALSYALAYNISFQLTGKESIKDKMFQFFSITLANAATADANERVSRKAREAEAIRARSS